VIRKETVVPDDMVTASWKRLTDEVKTPCGETVDGSFADTFRTPLRQTSQGRLIEPGEQCSFFVFAYPR
jgi:hypothetical protein